LSNILPKLIKEENIVYAGFSAALYVISPTIHGADLVDDPNKIPEGYMSDFSWKGLSILDKSIAVHFKSDHSESEDIDKEIEYYKHHDLPFDVLRDGEVYFENGELKEFLRI
jgi:dipeptidase E